ncbi:hypothetical protein SAMN06298226_1029 [Nitrosovibrio sp. Nv4]|nr:hypothetical protein SAMN06298226_1029 [Nitrosovibrio sp. Nv4]
MVEEAILHSGVIPEFVKSMYACNPSLLSNAFKAMGKCDSGTLLEKIDAMINRQNTHNT